MRKQLSCCVACDESSWREEQMPCVWIPKGIDYIMAQPRMQLYIDYSAKIYGIYLKYISKEDIHVYSIDEVFMDVTEYLSLYGMTAKELGIRIMQDIFDTVGIRATCGIGTNLYLAKIALDITGNMRKILSVNLMRKVIRGRCGITDHSQISGEWSWTCRKTCTGRDI